MTITKLLRTTRLCYPHLTGDRQIRFPKQRVLIVDRPTTADDGWIVVDISQSSDTDSRYFVLSALRSRVRHK